MPSRTTRGPPPTSTASPQTGDRPQSRMHGLTSTATLCLLCCSSIPHTALCSAPSHCALRRCKGSGCTIGSTAASVPRSRRVAPAASSLVAASPPSRSPRRRSQVTPWSLVLCVLRRNSPPGWSEALSAEDGLSPCGAALVCAQRMQDEGIQQSGMPGVGLQVQDYASP